MLDNMHMMFYNYTWVRIVEKLKKLRLEKNWKCKDMSEMLGISKTYYWQLENDDRRLSYPMAFKIAKLFKKKPDEIFYDDYKAKEQQQ